MRRTILATLLTVALSASSSSLAGRGAGELLLDRAAVGALLASGTPEILEITVPGFGALTLTLQPPAVVEFRDGGIEGIWVVILSSLGYRSAVRVRLVPDLEPLEGVLHLRPEWARPETLPPMGLDLAPLLPSIALPRGLQGLVPGFPDPGPSIRLDVQGVEILEERLTIRFGLSVLPGGR